MKYMNNHYTGSRVFGKARCKMPMNLQFFAEGDGGGSGGGSSAGDGAGTGSESQGAAGAGGEGGQGAAGSGSNQTFDDLLKTPGYQSEFDKRVAKALETQKTKMQQDIQTQIESAKTEAEKMAKMNAEQKSQYEREKKEAELSTREAELTKRELMAEAKEQLAGKGLPISLAEVLNYSSAEECTKSIEAVGKSFQEAVEKAVNEKLTGGNPPTKAKTTASFTSEQIKAMSAEEINKNWDAVQAAMKNGI